MKLLRTAGIRAPAVDAMRSCGEKLAIIKSPTTWPMGQCTVKRSLQKMQKSFDNRAKILRNIV